MTLTKRERPTKSWFENGPGRCRTKAQADSWLESEVTAMTSKGVPEDAARTAVIEALGFATGLYADLDVARRVYDLWGAAHPLFGTPDQRAMLRGPQDYAALAAACQAILAGDVKARA